MTWTKGLEPSASAVTGQQRDVTDGYQTVSADVVRYTMIPGSICYRQNRAFKFNQYKALLHTDLAIPVGTSAAKLASQLVKQCEILRGVSSAIKF